MILKKLIRTLLTENNIVFAKMKKFKHVTHVIFDMDGLLLNTEDIYTVAFKQICEPYGKIYDWETKKLCMGNKFDVGSKIIIDRLQLPITVPQLKEKFDAIIDDLFHNSELLEGALKLVEHLVDSKIPVALCSGSSIKGYQAKTKNHQQFFTNFNPKVLCSDDPEVKFGKPNPDAYEVTRKRFTGKIPAPESCLVFEDSYNGVLSALAAGMQCVMVPDPRVEQEQKDKATLCLGSLLEFKPEEFGLPPYK